MYISLVTLNIFYLKVSNIPNNIFNTVTEARCLKFRDIKRLYYFNRIKCDLQGKNTPYYSYIDKEDTKDKDFKEKLVIDMATLIPT